MAGHALAGRGKPRARRRVRGSGRPAGLKRSPRACGALFTTSPWTSPARSNREARRALEVNLGDALAKRRRGAKPRAFARRPRERRRRRP
jgi:hypothetical protein